MTTLIEAELKKLVKLGAINSYLPLANKRFIITVNGKLLRTNAEQVLYFIAGAHAVAQAWLADRRNTRQGQVS